MVAMGTYDEVSESKKKHSIMSDARETTYMAFNQERSDKNRERKAFPELHVMA